MPASKLSSDRKASNNKRSRTPPRRYYKNVHVVTPDLPAFLKAASSQNSRSSLDVSMTSLTASLPSLSSVETTLTATTSQSDNISPPSAKATEDVEAELHESISNQSSYFIPGITGRALCLSSSTNDERKQEGSEVSPEQDENNNGDDESTVVPSFFIPGINGTARCLKSSSGKSTISDGPISPSSATCKKSESSLSCSRRSKESEQSSSRRSKHSERSRKSKSPNQKER